MYLDWKDLAVGRKQQLSGGTNFQLTDNACNQLPADVLSGRLLSNLFCALLTSKTLLAWQGKSWLLRAAVKSTVQFTYHLRANKKPSRNELSVASCKKKNYAVCLAERVLQTVVILLIYSFDHYCDT